MTSGAPQHGAVGSPAAGALIYLLSARAARDFGDGFVAVLLPFYLMMLGYTPFEVGAIATAPLLGSALLTLGIGMVGSRHDRRRLLIFVKPPRRHSCYHFTAASQETIDRERPMSFAIPQPLKSEHDHLHEELRAAIAMGGRTGKTARLVAERLHPHFLREEAYALPPLGLLSALSRSEGAAGISPVDAEKAIKMAHQLAAEMPRMLAEHQEIVGALHALIAAAQEESHGNVVAFAEKLMLHAQTEEEVLYPAAILVGRHLKAVVQSKSGAAGAAPI
jgi:hypothetical protein